MDRIEFRRHLDRYKRSAVTREAVAFYQEVERMLDERRTNHEQPVATPEQRKLKRRVYMRDLMRRKRARDRQARPTAHPSA